jgi:myo-inositol-1(or 4)-monophosphatase
VAANEPVEMSRALIATGFNYVVAHRAAQGRLVSEILPLVRDIRRFGSAALDLCYVACGQVDGYFEEFVNDWDVAAGMLIATEAGAVAGPLSVLDRASGVVAAGSTLYGELCRALSAARAGG